MLQHVKSKSADGTQLRFMWLEITGRCQLECAHCYASSGPSGTHGRMTRDSWARVIEDAAGLGVPSLQFIGGEPTLHPDLPRLIELAVEYNMEVEVFSNLAYVTPALWDTFSQTGVSLATSWYSDNPNEHTAITNRNSFNSTKTNIAEAVRRDIPIRVGIIGINEDQRVEQARQILIDLGVKEDSIGYDDLRQVGRGIRDAKPGPDQLCGHCADGVLAISPEGEVWPCVFSRFMPLGNVLEQPLSDLLEKQVVKKARSQLIELWEDNMVACIPSKCEPQCPPRCSPACSPCAPGNRCWPYYDED
ncbi:radical SAM/SPASM domain-containing protein [Laceyella tengchongensis]|jgi:MoaA/NifB/PqqE/SkfB family radical SAM enzyme